jgi:demethylmenaquinone methyltransferase/2-methoxy-6-polyprenyl-1,4-benzoquinol methylase
MQDYYAARASEYDRVYAKPERQEDLRAIERWLPARFEGRRVLELACGTGWWTRVIAPAAAHVVAVDAAPETLAIARERVAGLRVELVVGDAYDPPRAAPPYDAAFAGFWLSHVPRARLDAFLRALHAVLQPGSTIVFLDNRWVEGSSSPIVDRDAAGDTWQVRRLDDGTTHRVLKNFPEEAELRALVERDAARVDHVAWRHYWALAYTLAA